MFDWICVYVSVAHNNYVYNRIPYWYWKNDEMFGNPIYYPCVLGSNWGWACLEMAGGSATKCTVSSSISSGEWIPFINYIFGYNIIKKG